MTSYYFILLALCYGVVDLSLFIADTLSPGNDLSKLATEHTTAHY